MKNTCIRLEADPKLISNCKETIANANDSFGILSKTLSLAGNEVRLKILYLLHKESKLCVCDLSDILEMKIPAISQHLRKMKDGEIVQNNKVGQTIYYSINPFYESFFSSFFKVIDGEKLIEEFA